MTKTFPRVVGALLSCAALTALPLPAQAQEAADKARSFNLPAQPLARALAAFTRASGVTVVADGRLTRAKRSAAVRGTLAPRAALEQMLRNTGLRAQSDGHAGYVLLQAPAPAPRTTAFRANVPPVAQAASQPEAPTAEIMVFGRLAKDTVLTIPQSVEVIDSRLIATSGSDTVGDALRFIPGASRDGSSLDAFGDTYLIRGFEANQTINGIASSTMRQGRDTIGIERVEVLKGPASVLYGQLKPGAVVNIVTKQPKRDFETSAGLSFGRYDDWRGKVDVTGPLAEGGDLRFRVTGAYDDADSFVDYWHRRHLFVAPVLAFDVDAATTLTIEGAYSYNRLRGFYNGLPAEGTVLPNANGRFGRALTLTDPTFAPSIRKDSEITARIEHRFSESIRWRTAVSWMHEYRNEGTVFGLLGWADDEKRSLMRAVLASVASGDNWTAHTDLNLGFNTGPISHEVVVGGDYTWFDRYTVGSTSLAPDLNLYTPVYELTTRPQTTLIPSRNTTVDEGTRTAGLFAQDRIGITDSLKLVAGVRWSDYRQTVVGTRGTGAPTAQRQHQTAWTTQFGLLYMPTPTLSLFANRTTSFLPVQGITANGSALKPETGRQYEVGAKAELLNGRLSLNGALFHLKRGNVAVADRVTPGFLLPIGAQVSKGFELSAATRPLEGMTLYAGYTYTHAETTKDTNPDLVGKHIRNIPRNGIVLRGNYEVRGGALSGLSLGGSGTYTGKRAADIQETFDLPGYWRFDAQVDYAVTPNVSLGASLENLTDKRYFTHAFSEFEVWPGAPRTWRLNVKTRF